MPAEHAPVKLAGRRDAARLLIVTYLSVRAFWIASGLTGRATDAMTPEALVKLALWVPTCLLVVWVLGKESKQSPFTELGLGAGAFRGLIFGLIATTPMVIALIWLPRKPLDPDLVAGSAIIGPFAEELLFRGFLFRQLIRRGAWSVPAALIVSSLFFGLAHVRNIDLGALTLFSGDWLPLVVFYGLPYAAGGAVFAWVAYRWKSLWPAIALHGFINFWWDLTQGEHARLVFQFDLLSAAQALSVALAIGLTLRWTAGQVTTGDDR